MKLKPLDDRVVIKPEQAEEKTSGGIVLPDTAREKPMVGNGQRAPMSVKKGDLVVYGKYSGSDVELDGVEYKIMRESEILGVVED